MELVCAGALAFCIAFYKQSVEWSIRSQMCLKPLKGIVLVYYLIFNGEIDYFNNTKMNVSVVVVEQFIHSSSCLFIPAQPITRFY